MIIKMLDREQRRSQDMGMHGEKEISLQEFMEGVRDNQTREFIERIRDNAAKVEVGPSSKDIILGDFGPVGTHYRTFFRSYDLKGDILEEAVTFNFEQVIFFPRPKMENGMSYRTGNLLIAIQQFFQLRELLPEVEIELSIPEPISGSK